MKTYLRKEARRHGSSLRITNKKIEHDMEKFFKDKNIMNFNQESAKMTGESGKDTYKDAAKKKGRPKKDDKNDDDLCEGQLVG